MIPIYKRKIGVSVLLSIFTLGFYQIYWKYLLVKNMKAIQNDDSRCTREMLCLIFVPFYSLYWWITRAAIAKNAFSEHKYCFTGNETLYCVLNLFGLEIIALSVLQNNFNSLQTVSVEGGEATFLKSMKVLLKNKYYIIICSTYILTQIYASVIGIGTYYAKYILGDENIFSTLSLAINITMVVALLALPIIIKKMGGMYKLNMIGYAIAILGRVGVMVAGYMGSIPLMLVFTAVATLGIAPYQGDLNALIASCSEYTTHTTGYHLEGMMYSCSSLGIKLGGAFGTAICGWLLDAAGYVENAAVQTPATVGMLQFLYLWAPAILCAGVLFLLYFLKIEKANADILAKKKAEG